MMLLNIIKLLRYSFSTNPVHGEQCKSKPDAITCVGESPNLIPEILRSIESRCVRLKI
jgi:hypothetical protein